MSCDEIHAESQTADKDARLNCKQIRQVIELFYRRYKKNLYGK